MTPKGFLIFCLVILSLSYRKSIWMATRFLGMSVYICHHDLGRHPKFPNQNQPVTELCLASLANMLWTSLRWKSCISFNGIRTSTNHGGILQSRDETLLRNWMAVKRLVSGQRHLHLFLLQIYRWGKNFWFCCCLSSNLQVPYPWGSRLLSPILVSNTTKWYCWWFRNPKALPTV